MGKSSYRVFLHLSEDYLDGLREACGDKGMSAGKLVSQITEDWLYENGYVDEGEEGSEDED